jgi:hypothetical protein
MRSWRWRCSRWMVRSRGRTIQRLHRHRHERITQLRFTLRRLSTRRWTPSTRQEADCPSGARDSERAFDGYGEEFREGEEEGATPSGDKADPYSRTGQLPAHSISPLGVAPSSSPSLNSSPYPSDCPSGARDSERAFDGYGEEFREGEEEGATPSGLIRRLSTRRWTPSTRQTRIRAPDNSLHTRSAHSESLAVAVQPLDGAQPRT